MCPTISKISFLLGWVGGQQKYAPARGRDERKKRKGTVRTVLRLLGSCLPLGWTLVPFRLRLEWHLAKQPQTTNVT